MPCQLIIWAAAIIAAGYEFTGYEVFVNGAQVYSGPERSVEYCFDETTTYLIEVVTVGLKVETGEVKRSFKAINHGNLEALRPPADEPVFVVGCADLDLDGVVGYKDFMKFAGQFQDRCEYGGPANE